MYGYVLDNFLARSSVFLESSHYHEIVRKPEEEEEWYQASHQNFNKKTETFIFQNDKLFI